MVMTILAELTVMMIETALTDYPLQLAKPGPVPLFYQTKDMTAVSTFLSLIINPIWHYAHHVVIPSHA